MRVVLEGVLYSRAGSVTGFTVYVLQLHPNYCTKKWDRKKIGL